MGQAAAKMAPAFCPCSAEFISIFYGEDVTEEQAAEASAIFQAACPNAELSVLSGGQPGYYYIISVE